MRTSKLIARIALIGVLASAIAVPITTAYAKNLKGTWKGQSPKSGRKGQGGWELKNGKMYFRGRSSACPRTAIPVKVTEVRGVVTKINGRGCGATWNCTRSGNEFTCPGNKYKARIVKVRKK
jgi:hypothetical protein